jgi:hypothetical protein
MSKSALLALVLGLAALPACDGDDHGVTLSGDRGDACDDLGCPMATGTSADVVVRSETEPQAGLVLRSSDDAVFTAERGVLVDGLQSWSLVAHAAGTAELQVLAADGRELTQRTISVAPADRLGLAYVTGTSAEASFFPVQVFGPSEREGYDESWLMGPGTKVTFLAFPVTADGAPMFGAFDDVTVTSARADVEDLYTLPGSFIQLHVPPFAAPFDAHVAAASGPAADIHFELTTPGQFE